MITQDELQVYMKIQDDIETLAVAYLNMVDKDGRFDHATVEGDMVDIEYTSPSGCGCCSDTDVYESMPIAYLFDENWMAVEKEKRMEADAKMLRQKIAHDKEKQEKKDKDEFDRYQKLKEKYES